MRFLYHHRTQAEDGQAVHIRSMISALREEGHEVLEEALVLRAQASHGPAPAAEARPGGQVDVPSGWGRLAGAAPRFVRELAEHAYTWPARGRLVRAARSWAPDCLYERYAFGNRGGLLAARQLGLPLVLEVNSPMVLELGRTRGLSFPGLARRAEVTTFRGATRVCVVTQVLGDMLVELGVDAQRIFVTPNGVHPELYEDPDPVAARTDLGLPPEPGLVLGFTGYYRDWHRLERVVEALTDPALADARLVLVGTGPAEASIRDAASSCCVSERVHLCGPRDHGEIPGLLAAFDIGLVPAINPYASPLKLHEYMAAGLACVAPDQPNLREVLTQGEDALLVDPSDPDDLRQALVRLAGEVGLRGDLGRAARRTVAARDLTWRGNARRVVEQVEQARREAS